MLAGGGQGTLNGAMADVRQDIGARSSLATRRSLTRFAWLSIAAAVLTIGLKTTAYLITGSVGLLSDAVESLVNLVGGVLALAMLTVAARPADDRALVRTDHHVAKPAAGHGSRRIRCRSDPRRQVGRSRRDGPDPRTGGLRFPPRADVERWSLRRRPSGLQAATAHHRDVARGLIAVRPVSS